MPYVPPEVKERIKREISVQRLAEARGIQVVIAEVTLNDSDTSGINALLLGA